MHYQTFDNLKHEITGVFVLTVAAMLLFMFIVRGCDDDTPAYAQEIHSEK